MDDHSEQFSSGEGQSETDIIRVAAILPSYNEADHIGLVLLALRFVPCISEIIVVDDGSQDCTPAIVARAALEDPRINLIRHAANLGKGQAIFTGWRATQAEVLLLLDSDLCNLTPDHVLQLIGPVLDRSVHMTIGLFKGGRPGTDFSHWATPWLSGQRCLQANLLRKIPREAAQGYGFETTLTLAARHFNWKVQQVTLQGVSHPPSEYHRGMLPGLWTRVRMYAQILRAWLIFHKSKNQHYAKNHYSLLISMALVTLFATSPSWIAHCDPFISIL